jgi:hypothetical protein
LSFAIEAFDDLETALALDERVTRLLLSVDRVKGLVEALVA